MNSNDLTAKLIEILSENDKILGIGQACSVEVALIPGKSDIDLFVLCSGLPGYDERKESYAPILSEQCAALQMEVCNCAEWGIGDILTICGIDVMPMYFQINQMREYLAATLRAEHLNKNGRFYPVGRLATVSEIHVLYEKQESFSRLRAMVNAKPDSFFKAWYQNEICQVIDEEDLGRSELRKEVLFYHQVLENALDHLLQALFAVNHVYFPSRKRTLAAIDGFPRKPENASKRLLAIIENGATADNITKSIDSLRCFTAETAGIGDKIFK